MNGGNWAPEDSIAEMKRLITSGMLGYYNEVEVTEIVAFHNRSAPTNVFTLLVAEEAPNPVATKPEFLNSDTPLRVAGLRGWSFGIYRYRVLLEQLVPAFERLSSAGIWDLSGEPFQHQAQTARPPQFVPPDSIKEIAWNRVLKNNFWNGSYVLEWADTQKAKIEPILRDTRRLQALSTAISEHVPLHLASLSDRLGAIVLQLPITVLMARFVGLRNGSILVEAGWHPKASPRPLRANIQVEFDSVTTGYCSSPVIDEQTEIPLPPGPGSYQATLWDEANGLILATTSESAFLQSIMMNMRSITPEPRIFTLPDVSGEMKEVRVQVHTNHKSLVGEAETDGNAGWTRRRMYRDETTRLVEQRRFVQYRPLPGNQAAEHERALHDIRYLIDLHGEEGAWLWDPFLSSLDILKTLFFSPHSSSDLRGLTARRVSVEEARTKQVGDFYQEQRATIAAAQCNFQGLRLEYRARNGQAGWDFHDRFLIFPQADGGALAWSLGTSVNSVGKAHHILQRVDDGQQVMDAFVDLWDQLSAPEHLIWKTPSR